MTTIKAISFAILATTSLASNANEVVKHIPDNSVGKVVGGWTSFLVGGAVAGPIGAIVVGLAGAWAGGNVQEEIGSSGNAYLIRLNDGSEQVFRSPNFVFKPGDKVEIEGIRAVPLKNTQG